MKQGAKGYISARLVEAREARGLSGVQLADLVGITRSSISLYETGRTLPRQEVAENIAKALNLPLDFFFIDYNDSEESAVYFRAHSSASKGQRTRAERRLGWLRRIVQYLEERIELPKVRIPDYISPENTLDLTSNSIEDIAEK